MNSYPALKPKVEAMVEKVDVRFPAPSQFNVDDILLNEVLIIFQMKSDYSSTHVAKPQSSLEYVLAMEQFREIMMDQMSTSAAEELAIKFKTRKLEALNAKLIQKIAGDDEVEVRNDRQAGARTRNGLLRRNNQAEKENEEEVECKEAYEHMLQQHIIDEKNQRTRR
ncbi:Uncharacterized protein OBRU01_00344 [Operophtera brumata]|uniref:Uncharacterized protein n=1 Tax=Operophtera brumata TaxID=104452 RepID=A0A0L7LU92_OPEBR|nr:Uncharacterized protein OBRU01_00344 [Operophtera brumata]